MSYYTQLQGRYRVDLKQTAKLVADSYNATPGGLSVDREELQRRLMATPEEEQEVYLEVFADSLVLSGGGEREVFRIEDAKESDEAAVLCVVDENGERWEFRLREVGPGAIHVGCDEHSIGQYAWRRVE